MRRLNRLTDRFVRTASIGKHHDGLGLLLQVTQGSAGDLNRSWLLRYSVGKKSPYAGLGRFPDVGLSDARTRVAAAEALLSRGWGTPTAHVETGPPGSFADALDAVKLRAQSDN